MAAPPPSLLGPTMPQTAALLEELWATLAGAAPGPTPPL
jgi:hypothetical protein